MTWTILQGDCVDRMRELPDASVDAVVCDPPYGLSAEPDMAEVLRHWLAGDDYVHRGGGFMGRSWDSFVPGPSVWRECLRVLKPGGHLLAFFGTRTADLGGVAIRLAGFEIRDTIAWMYGSGFPKSLDVSKAIDKAAGAEREVVGRAAGAASSDTNSLGVFAPEYDATIAATPEAQTWEGWGTALKPAHEPIVVARKPLAGTVAGNVLAHGTGAINVDACRIDGEMPEGRTRHGGGIVGNGSSYELPDSNGAMPSGRWPANVVLSHSAGVGWYSPANGLDTETVASYYGVGEAVRALREADPRNARAAGETQVLLAGVRWRFPEGEAQDGMGDDRLPAVRDDVRGDPGVGAERPSAVLLPSVPREGEQPAQGTPREASHAGEPREDVSGAAGAPGTGEVVAVEGRNVPGSVGVPPRDDRAPAGTGADVRAGDAAEEQVHPGAQGGGGSEGRSTTDAAGGRASSRRPQGEQRPGESVRGGAGSAQPRASQSRAGAAGGEGEDRGAGGGVGRLEVREDLIPQGWASSFVLVDTVECVPVGTRRVKTGTAVQRNRDGNVHNAVYGPYAKPPVEDVTFADADGMETVTAWECVPGCPVRMLDEQTGESVSGAPRADRGRGGIWSPSTDGIPAGPQYGDSGGASRFFYVAKASSAERNAGLDGFEAVERRTMDGGELVSDGRTQTRGSTIARNVHPTVKPIELMRWLIRLVTPPGGTVLDPFLGSGTTGCAAVLEGVSFIGVEREAEYVPIAEARIRWWAEHPEGVELVKRLERERDRKATADAGQVSMFDLLEGA